MGTRSKVIVREYGTDLVAIYKQYDGYPEGRGVSLAKFLVGLTVVNGIPSSSGCGGLANGMECLAAQLVAAEKVQVGDIYLVPVTDKMFDGGVEFLYTVDESPSTGDIIMCMFDSAGGIANILFTGTPKEFLEKYDKPEGE